MISASAALVGVGERAVTVTAMGIATAFAFNAFVPAGVAGRPLAGVAGREDDACEGVLLVLVFRSLMVERALEPLARGIEPDRVGRVLATGLPGLLGARDGLALVWFWRAVLAIVDAFFAHAAARGKPETYA